MSRRYHRPVEGDGARPGRVRAPLEATPRLDEPPEKEGNVQRHRRSALAVVLGVGALAILTPTVLAGPETNATVRFGNDDVGSSYPPITEHDESGNGKFNLIPRTVTIPVGGRVTYDILVRFGIHQPTVYEAGTTPEDIDIQGPFPFINDPDGRIEMGPRCQRCNWHGHVDNGPRNVRQTGPLPHSLQLHATLRRVQHVRLGERQVANLGGVSRKCDTPPSVTNDGGGQSR